MLSVIIPTDGVEQPTVATLAALVPGAAAGVVRANFSNRVPSSSALTLSRKSVPERALRAMLVFTPPGWTTDSLRVLLLIASSWRSDSEKPRTANFDAE